jgi:hypothetical protein
MTETEFVVSFPSRETLRMSTRSDRLFLPLSQYDVGIREAFLEPKPGKAFPSVWVQITGIPNDLLEPDRLMAAMMMLGWPMEVDELSIRKWEIGANLHAFAVQIPGTHQGHRAIMC